MRIRRIFGVLLMAVAFVSASVIPATANQPVAGSLAFRGTAHLNQFQCVLGNCSGSFTGTATGGLAGVANGIPWSAAIADVGFDVSFTYADSCFGVGIANGGGTIHSFLGKTTGTYGPVPGVLELPAPVTEVLIPFTLSWDRIGVTAVLSVDTDVRLRVVGPGPVLKWVDVVTDHQVTAVAAFVPLNAPSPGVCTGAETMTLDALVAAVVELS